ncbi:MAG: GFA family protein [Gammaproteobacteria bacterium]|nr:GFA family protein [Gammaproteobacteria bacterium]
MTSAAGLRRYAGGCHCGAVRFEVEAPEQLEVVDCNCSICRMSGFLHLIVPATRFHLRAGADALATYTFNTGIARHTFCRTCGIKAFYVPRSNPDGIDVNLRCLDEAPRVVDIRPFDGHNWEDHAGDLAQLSRGD